MATQTAGPVKMVFEYRVRPGLNAEFESWVRALLDAAGRAGGLEGSSVLTAGTPDHFYLLLRFASAGDLHRWETSSECEKLRVESERLTTTGAPQVREGLATWFTLPEQRTSADPPKWKMALVTWSALYPQIAALWFVMQPLGLPPLLGQAVSSAICTASLAWVVMPFLTRRLRPWLVRRS